MSEKATYKCLLCQNSYNKIDRLYRNNMTKLSTIPSIVYPYLVRDLGVSLPNTIQCCINCKREKGKLSLWQCVKRGVFSEIIFLKIFFKTYKSALLKLTTKQVDTLLEAVFYEYYESNDSLKYKIKAIIKNSIATGNYKPWKTLEREM